MFTGVRSEVRPVHPGSLVALESRRVHMRRPGGFRVHLGLLA